MEKIKAKIVDYTIIALEFKTILYNDNFHTFDEVIIQLQKAVNCCIEKAKEIAMEAHCKGKTVIYIGELRDCLRVSSILEEIALRAQIVT